MELNFVLAVLLITSRIFIEGMAQQAEHPLMKPGFNTYGDNMPCGAKYELWKKDGVYWNESPAAFFLYEKFPAVEESFCFQCTSCADIRWCNMAAASLAMGGIPALCGWVGKGVPMVCCGTPYVLGPDLKKKIEAEKARRRECGTRSFDIRVSPTENKFYAIFEAMPLVNKSSMKFDPPLDVSFAAVSPVGGGGANAGEFPWMVSIRKDGEHWCGGSLIDRVHILTAAHCFMETRDPANYLVRVGHNYADKGFPFGIKKIVIHPEYSDNYHYHDLAILTLSEEILVPQMAHICLPDPQMPDLAGENTTLLGWGDTSYEGVGPEMLHVVYDIPVVPWQECRKKYKRTSEDTLPNGITENFICAGLPEGGKDACQRDSGGPLMYKDKSKTRASGEVPWTLVGVVSFGKLCALPGYPGVYIRVADYMPWIIENMNL